jgi:hypothetical protein
MSQFDSYRPEAWQNDGLTVSAPVHALTTQVTRKRNKKWTVVLTATVISFGATAILSFPFPTVAVKASSVFKVMAGVGDRDMVGSDVPIGYWPRLVSTLRNAPTLPDDSSVSDPDPIV